MAANAHKTAARRKNGSIAASSMIEGRTRIKSKIAIIVNMPIVYSTCQVWG